MDEPEQPTPDEREVTDATKREGPGSKSGPKPEPSSYLTRGTLVGRYVVIDVLGEGGMGVVYGAFDPELDRKVAIKLLQARHGGSDGEQAWLLREAQALARLSHPNVIAVHDVGTLPGDRVFVAMELVDGRTLRQWLEDKPRSWRDVLPVMRAAGAGLAAAHAAGLVHRDFKPDNVIVGTDGRVRVMDFGLARLKHDDNEPAPTKRIDALGAGSATPTLAGAIVGTPAYMAPELYRGEAADARSDQFAFGVTLCEALFRTRPYAKKDLVAGSPLKPKPLPDIGVPTKIQHVVLRAISGDPDARYASMDELLAELSVDSTIRRRHIAIGALGITAVAATAAVVGWRARPRDASQECAVADTELAGVWDASVRTGLEKSFAASKLAYADTSAKRVEALLDDFRAGWIAMRTETCRATRVRGDQSEHLLDVRMACLDRRLGEVHALTSLLTGDVDPKAVEKSVAAASAVTPLAGCADTTSLMQDVPTDPAKRARVADLYRQFDRITATARIGRSKEALAPARTLVADVRATGDARLLAEAIDLQGTLETRNGDLKAAQVTLADALRRARQLGDADLFVTAAIDLGDELGEGGISTSREALGVVRVALALVDDTHNPTLRVRILFEQGDDFMTLAHPKEAQQILEDAERLCRRTLGEDHVLMFQIQALLGSAQSHNGDQAKALAVYRSLVDHATRVLGAAHPTTIGARLKLCRILADGGDRAGAVACYVATMPDGDRVLGSSNRELLSFRAHYGVVLAELGKNKEARDVLAETLTRVPTDAWAEKWFVASDIARMLGAVEIELGDFKSALDHCQMSEAATEQQHSPLGDGTCIGEALLGLGESKRALAALEAEQGSIEGNEPAAVGAWRFAYARAIWAVRHQATQAHALAEKARTELVGTPRLAQLDAWLATLPE